MGSRLFARTVISLGAMVVSSVGVPAGSAAIADDPIQDAREVQTHWTADFDLPHPEGLAYDPVSGSLLVATAGEGEATVLRLTRLGDPAGVLRLPGLPSPRAISYDTAQSRLVGLADGEVLSYPAAELRKTRPSPTRANVPGLRIEDARGATFDPESGRWFVLNGRVVTVVDFSTSGAPSVSDRISLGGVGKGLLHGLAFNPADGLLYVGSPVEGRLYGVDLSGTTRTTYSLAALDLQSPVAMTFAPSADSTDDPAALHLFVADEGTSSRSGAVMEVTLAPAAAVTAPIVTATLVQTIATSGFVPGSPDPSGVVYLPSLGRLQICDSEVDEVTGAGYHGVNLWQTNLQGLVMDRGTTFPRYSKEPTGLGHDPGTNTLFISDDSAKRIWIVKPGTDGRFGTADDPLSSVNPAAYGSGDTEDPEFDSTTGNLTSGHLFFLDGVNTEVYDIDPVNEVFGDGNDVVTQFDVGLFGPTDFEGLASDPVRNTLLVGARTTKRIYEVTKSGSLIRIIDASGIPGLKYISGLAVAPASDGSGRLNYWIVDRAIDNGPDPTENDGKLFEITVPVADAPPSVTITAPPNGSTVSGQVTVAANASDDIGVTRVEFFDGAASIGVDTNGTDGWSVLWNSTAVTDGSHVLRATATDTINQTGTSTITVTVRNTDSPPTVTITSPPNGSTVSGQVTVAASASDDIGVTRVEFFDGAASIGVDTNGTNGWSVPWNTQGVAAGSHVLTAVGTDTAGQSTTSSGVGVTVDNIPPSSVAITAPANNQVVAGSVTVAATAVDNQAVVRVEFFVDGTTSIGADTNSSDGWSILWNTLGTTAGGHQLTAVAADAAGNATTSAPVAVTVANPSVMILDIPVATGLDDVEERNSKGNITTSSTDLDMMTDRGSLQYAVGLRFTGVQVPQGATITGAYVQFRADEVGTEAVTLTVAGHASDNAPAFTTAKFNVTQRLRTSPVTWSPAPWSTKGRAGPEERTPDLRSVLQEIVNRPQWAAGGAVVVIITGPGSGTRVADAFEGGSPPILHIEYGTP